MDCTTTYTNRNKTSRGGFTLVEVLIASGIGTLVLAGVLGFYLFAGRSFSAMENYVQLDLKSRTALDTMSRDIREANRCSTNGFTSSDLTLLMTDPATGQPYTVNYSYNNAAGTVTRTDTRAGGARTILLLNDCTSFAFSYFQRNPANGAWAAFPNDPGRADECKLVQIDWTCARSVLGTLINSESMESARVVIRKK
jgi:prepilin-type N-terminal cleavage/methylation domain-containing protein